MSSHFKRIVGGILVLSVMLCMPISAIVAEDLAYQMPSQAIADLVDAPITPRLSISPDNQWMLLQFYPGLPDIEEVSQPELRLAGVRINPKTNGPSRGWYYTGLVLKNIESSEEIQISNLPPKPRITNVSWSPDSRNLAFLQTDSDGLKLWVVDIASAQARQLTELKVNAALGSSMAWLSDNRQIVFGAISGQRGTAPQAPAVPSGPVIQENVLGKTPARTYQDLLRNQYDEELFDYYMTSQLIVVNLDGQAMPLGQPGIIAEFNPSPNGKYLLVETIHRPYSYTVPYSRFPLLIEVWDFQGAVAYQVANVPLADKIPISFGSVRTGRRNVGWRDDQDATLHWVEARDDGDAGKEVEIRDEVFMQPAPFKETPTSLVKLELRYGGVYWGSDDLAIASEFWWKTRKTRSWVIQPGKPDVEPVLLFDHSSEDRYADPGSPVLDYTQYGTSVLATADNGQSIFLIGAGASPDGDRPFLDKLNLNTKAKTRLFQSEAPFFERPIQVLDWGKSVVLTSREAVDAPPNYFRRDLNSGNITALTEFPHPTPSLLGVKKELIRYKRADGVDLTATLYLPPDYRGEMGPLPTLVWAYPQEYKSADAAGQVTDSPYRFIRVSWASPLLFLLEGYAVIDDPSMPIIGEGTQEPNDTYVPQLVAGAQAAINEAARRGVTDPKRVAVGGHSYGAFMTANLLAHSDLFRAGIARSGAYNRTLTPFGFQAEERSLWEAPEVYITLSPFMHADKINEPILLVHGEADNNSGTFPMQSERFFAALKGAGTTARLVMLPNESHGYRARESVMHVLWETSQWLDKYVKNADVTAPVETSNLEESN